MILLSTSSNRSVNNCYSLLSGFDVFFFSFTLIPEVIAQWL